MAVDKPGYPFCEEHPFVRVSLQVNGNYSSQNPLLWIILG